MGVALVSVQALSWVLDHSPTKGAERLVLISLANHVRHVDEIGAWECWPEVETIRTEANLDTGGTVRSILRRLEEAGHIEIVLSGAPDARIRADQRPNLYRILPKP